MIKTNVLGTEYEIVISDLNDANLARDDGVCHIYDKRIDIRKPEYLCESGSSNISKGYRFRDVLLHELVHAFSMESGVSYDNDEALVDWIVRMLPKIVESYNEILAQLDKKGNQS